MNNIIKLFKITIISTFRNDNSKKKRKFNKSLILLLIAISFLPIMGSLVVMSKEMYKTLETINQGNIVIASSFMAGSIVVLVFGMFYTISSYYMAKDIPNYLYLPLKADEIIISRFLSTLMYEYLTLIIFVVPIVIGCGIGGNFNFIFYIIGFFIFMILPILPLSISSIIIIIIMSFSKKAINKDRYTLISGLLGLAIGLGINFSLQALFTQMDDPNMVKGLISTGQADLINNVASYFPGIKNATYAIINYDVVQLAIFVSIAIIAFLCFVFVAKKLYFKGVLGISQQPAKRKYDITTKEFGKQKNKMLAYTLKELRLIFRTPIYFMNLVLMDYLMPVIFIIAIISSNSMDKLIMVGKVIVTKNDMAGIIIGLVFVFFVFLSSMNGVTATCISREGEQIYIMKYLPISIKQQVNAKLLSGLIISVTVMIVVVILFSVFLKISMLITILLLLAGSNGVIFTRLIGLYIDLTRPKLKWNSEVEAVKHNMNLLFNMLLNMILAGGFAWLTISFSFNMLTSIFVYIIGFAILNYIVYMFINKKAYEYITRIE